MVFLGQQLKKLRDRLGLSTLDVERLTGVPQSRLSEIETGKTKSPRPDTVRKLCEGLHVDQEFFYLEDAKLPQDLMPDMPPEVEKFIMSGENIPYIVISEKAKREGIPPEVLQQMLDLLIANKK